MQGGVIAGGVPPPCESTLSSRGPPSVHVAWRVTVGLHLSPGEFLLLNMAGRCYGPLEAPSAAVMVDRGRWALRRSRM